MDAREKFIQENGVEPEAVVGLLLCLSVCCIEEGKDAQEKLNEMFKSFPRIDPRLWQRSMCP